jgi:hypothetical protein
MKFLYVISIIFLLLACADDSKDSPLAANSLAITDEDTLLSITISNASNFEAFIEHPSGHDVVITRISQAQRGVLSVDSSRRVLTYNPKGSLDYLMLGEVYQENITYSAQINGQEISGELVLMVTGTELINVCDNLPKVVVDFSQLTEHGSQDVQEGYCIQLDASVFSDNKTSQWSVWTGESGGNASEALFAYIGRDQSDAELTFLPPSAGRYHFAWCPIDNSECLASAGFNVQGREVVEPEFTVILDSSTININSQVKLEVSTNSTEYMNGDRLSYRWIVADTTDSEQIDIILDVLSYSPSINFMSPKNNTNLDIMVIAAGESFNLTSQGFYTSFAGGNHYSVPRGLYRSNTKDLYVRDPNGPKPPQSKLVVTGETQAYDIVVGSYFTFHQIQIAAGQSLMLDGASSRDPDGDALEYYWLIYHPGSGNRKEVVVTSSLIYTPTAEVTEVGQGIDFCVSDGFPWNETENPCHEIQINIGN